MLNKLNVIEDVTICAGVSFGITQIETILGIVILSIQILLIVGKGAYKVYQYWKNKQIEKIPETVNNTVDELNDLKDDYGNRNNTK